MAAARAAPAREADTRYAPAWVLLARRDCIDAYVLWLLDARDVELRSVRGKGRGPAKRSNTAIQSSATLIDKAVMRTDGLDLYDCKS